MFISVRTFLKKFSRLSFLNGTVVLGKKSKNNNSEFLVTFIEKKDRECLKQKNV